MKSKAFLRVASCVALIAGLTIFSASARAADDVKALLELLLEKGIITQDEYDKKIK